MLFDLVNPVNLAINGCKCLTEFIEWFIDNLSYKIRLLREAEAARVADFIEYNRSFRYTVKVVSESHSVILRL